MITSLLSILSPRAEPSDRAPGRAPVDPAAERRRDGKGREDKFEAVLDAGKASGDSTQAEPASEAAQAVAMQGRAGGRAAFELAPPEAEAVAATPEGAEEGLLAAVVADIDIVGSQQGAVVPELVEAASEQAEEATEAEADTEAPSLNGEAAVVEPDAAVEPTRTLETAASLAGPPVDARAATAGDRAEGDAASVQPVARGETQRGRDAPEPSPVAAVAAGRDAAPALAPDRPTGLDALAARPAEPTAANQIASSRAEPVAPSPAQPLVQAQTVIHQIGVAVGRGDAATIDIRLDPPELGRVHIQLNPTERGVQAIVFADRPETGDMLRRNADELARGLSQAGYGEVSLDFASREEAPNDPRAGRWLAELAPMSGGETADEPDGAERPARVPSDGLDIRL